MAEGLIVRPDKNEFLLFAMLNALGLGRGNPGSHLLRRKTTDHFKGYSGIGLKEDEYVHSSKPIGYVLTLNEAPDFSAKSGLVINPARQRQMEFGRAVLPHLKHFYENTDFEDFWKQILPAYQEECRFVQGILDRSGIKGLVARVWETDKSMDMEVIPMPLEGTHYGNGSSIGNTSYQVVGPPFDYSIVHLVGHEASHPIAKRVLAPISGEIAKRSHLLKHALKRKDYPKSYDHWPTCFEEHLIRAMQAAYINPVVMDKCFIEPRLKTEERGNGMVYIRDFYHELRKHKENPKGSLTDVALSILHRLDAKNRWNFLTHVYS